ncbi:MAG TPA: NUDIX domain-containing protein [Ktedonobacterales bacterium]
MSTSPHPAHHSERSTDNPDEIFDLVDENDDVIGTVRRGDAHQNPSLLHRSVQVVVLDSAGRLLLQLRSQRKDLFPGYYCASASGHVISGEDYETTARRELVEELGVSIAPVFLGKALVRSAFETEITALYVARSDGPFQFDPVETDGGAFFSWDELMSARERLPMTPALLAALDELGRLIDAGELALPW